MDIKRLYRSRGNRMVGGVCGGMAEYFSVDPALIRVIAVLIGMMTAGLGGIIAYVACMVIIPEGPV